MHFSILAFAALSMLALYCFHRRYTFKKSLTSEEYVRQIKDLLHPRIPMKQLLFERAAANKRLVRALHLSNTFVSANPQVHKEFITEAHCLLKHAQVQGWHRFQSIAVDAVQWQVSHQRKSNGIEESLQFDVYMQNITLVVVLVGLLHIEQPIDSFFQEDVALVCRSITTLWALSKKSDPIPPTILPVLEQHLRRLVPDEKKFPAPLNFVVPAWETLWRVVATTVAYSYDNPDIKKVFENFHASPTEKEFRGEPESEVNVKGIVNEAMRLHPPSKHIGRMRTSHLKNDREIMREVKEFADVGSLLRSDMWGMDANEFKPSRRMDPKQTEALSFIFGHGPLRCIAFSWAPMAAGVISAVILDHLSVKGYIVKPGKYIGSRDGWKDWTIERR